MKLYIYILLAISMFSCRKEIEYKGDAQDSFLIINGLIDNDSTIKVRLSKSRPAIGEQNIGPTDITASASLILTDNSTGETFTSNEVNSLGEYAFSTIAKTGHSYSVSVSHTDFKTAYSSNTIVPIVVPIINCDTSSVLYANEYSRFKKVDFSFVDPEIDNRYFIQVFSIDSSGVEENIWIESNGTINLSDDVSGSGLLFKDVSFNNTTKNVSLTFYASYHYDQITYANLNEKSYKIVLNSLSKEAYNYILSVNKSMNSNDIFSEPVKVYTNITNGFGIFGAVTKSVVIFD